MFTAKDARAVAFQEVVKTNEQLIKNNAATSSAIYLHTGGDARAMADEFQKRGFRTTVGHNGTSVWADWKG